MSAWTSGELAAFAAAVLELVSTIPGAIGFLRFKDVNESVKVISVDGVAAGQAAYQIKTAGK